jgi:hypothetical protein
MVKNKLLSIIIKNPNSIFSIRLGNIGTINFKIEYNEENQRFHNKSFDDFSSQEHADISFTNSQIIRIEKIDEVKDYYILTINYNN